ncbi:tRNA-binding protein [bacterium]|nr:tRNA-binding protein [Acidimicrobiaceae bacterium]MDC2977233.1 tRNA-binding protein [bacterium]
MDSNVENFANLDIRVGQILSAEVFEEAKKPAYILKIDFGSDIGIKKTSAQITNYKLDELVGVRCIGVINLGNKQIGPIISQCLILGSINKNGDVLLLQPSPEADLGDKVS